MTVKGKNGGGVGWAGALGKYHKVGKGCKKELNPSKGTIPQTLHTPNKLTLENAGFYKEAKYHSRGGAYWKKLPRNKARLGASKSLGAIGNATEMGLRLGVKKNYGEVPCQRLSEK